MYFKLRSDGELRLQVFHKALTCSRRNLVHNETTTCHVSSSMWWEMHGIVRKGREEAHLWVQAL